MKSTLKKILVPTDFSDLSLDSLDGATFIARSVGAEIILLHVFENSSFNSSIEKALSFNRNRDTLIQTAVDEKLAEIAENIKRKAGVPVTTMKTSGKIHQEIGAVAKKIKADIIVMGTHGVSGFDKFLLGTNANRVVSASECPVITFTENPPNEGLNKIVLPLDLTSETREKVGKAIELAKLFNATIDVISVLDTKDEFIVNKLTRQLNQVESYIRESGVTCKAAMLHGNIAKTVIDYAVKNKADLIMIMTQEEMGLADIFLGSSAQKMINNSPIPVFSIRPTKKKDTSTFRPY